MATTSPQKLKEFVEFTKQEGLCGDVNKYQLICTRKAQHAMPHKAVLLTIDDSQDVVLEEWQ